MSRHTPGPWTVGRCRHQEVWIDAPGGDPTLGFKAWDGLLSAWGSDDDPVRGLEVAKANAQVAACAPELLALLEEARECLGFDATAELLDRIDAVIVKAKGEQP